ncbi:unnamed protein product [Peniophora sp. CBMAI 1063]|nr:unnamed protein product [Peniophora sp. CBMAI 1063]
MRARTAPTRFVHVAAHKGNAVNEAADGLASKGARKAALPPFVPQPAPEPMDPVDARPLQGARVWTTMAEPGKAIGERPGWRHGGHASGKWHHGRARRDDTRLRKLAEILKVCHFNKVFWDAWKGSMDARKKRPQIPIDELARVFQTRMNRHAQVPDTFLQSARVQAQLLATNLDAAQPARPSDDDFTRP